MSVCVSASVPVCVRACVRACVRVCVRERTKAIDNIANPNEETNRCAIYRPGFHRSELRPTAALYMSSEQTTRGGTFAGKHKGPVQNRTYDHRRCARVVRRASGRRLLCLYTRTSPRTTHRCISSDSKPHHDARIKS
ncbi:hypothetical protein EVAR_87656_1 [Eumeta japonica]|uniref:Uncharacterized protein n=1 Tax=Eumeta variegata TaxID=151549 RepID=A0A4C1WLA2_EUMVA|nr:hypothetical protein EVAR_87656_1 [Eumeta japonica]